MADLNERLVAALRTHKPNWWSDYADAATAGQFLRGDIEQRQVEMRVLNGPIWLGIRAALTAGIVQEVKTEGNV